MAVSLSWTTRRGWRCLPTARLEESSDLNGCVFYFSGFDLVGPLGLM
jgi:hypothetical protein